MEVTGLAWVGTRTSEYESMVRLFRDGLGLRVAHERPNFAGFSLPNGDKEDPAVVNAQVTDPGFSRGAVRGTDA